MGCHLFLLFGCTGTGSRVNTVDVHIDGSDFAAAQSCLIDAGDSSVTISCRTVLFCDFSGERCILNRSGLIGADDPAKIPVTAEVFKLQLSTHIIYTVFIFSGDSSDGQIIL